MAKRANISVSGLSKIDAGIVIVAVRGDIGAVSEAVAAGAEAAQRVGEEFRALRQQGRRLRLDSTAGSGQLAGEKRKQRRLAGPAMADDGDALAATDNE